MFLRGRDGSSVTGNNAQRECRGASDETQWPKPRNCRRSYRPETSWDRQALDRRCYRLRAWPGLSNSIPTRKGQLDICGDNPVHGSAPRFAATLSPRRLRTYWKEQCRQILRSTTNLPPSNWCPTPTRFMTSCAKTIPSIGQKHGTRGWSHAMTTSLPCCETANGLSTRVVIPCSWSSYQTTSAPSSVLSTITGRVQELVDDLIDAVIEDGETDLVRDIATPLPATVIAEVLGLPTDDVGWFKQTTLDYISFIGTGAPSPIRFGEARLRCSSYESGSWA